MEYCSKLQLMVSPDHYRAVIFCDITGEPCVGYVNRSLDLDKEVRSSIHERHVFFDIRQIAQCPSNPERKRLQSYLDWVNNPRTDKWQPPED